MNPDMWKRFIKAVTAADEMVDEYTTCESMAAALTVTMKDQGLMVAPLQVTITFREDGTTSMKPGFQD